MCEICLDSIGRTIPHNCQEYDEFQNIENVMMRIFNILDESDKLMKIAENELEKIGGEKIE